MVAPPFVNDFPIFILNEVALLRWPAQHHRRNLTDGSRLLLARELFIPLGKSGLALTTYEQDEVQLVTQQGQD